MSNNNLSPGSKDILGFNDFRAKYKTWLLGLPPKTLKKYAIFAAVIILVLPTVASLLENIIPKFLTVALAFPAGVGLFAYLLGVAFFIERKRPQKLTIKERFSFSQRMKGTISGGLVAIALIIYVGRYIPYSFGGILALTVALTVYNLLQRTPQEIEIYESGALDPRDEISLKREIERAQKTKKKSKRNKKEVDDE